MAIDTENKRRSALGWFVLPAPDGTISDADRQHKVWKYSGIAATVAAAPTQPGIEHTLPTNRPHHALPGNLTHHTLRENRGHHTIPQEGNQ